MHGRFSFEQFMKYCNFNFVQNISFENISGARVHQTQPTADKFLTVVISNDLNERSLSPLAWNVN